MLRLISVLEILKNSEKIQIRLKLKSTEDALRGYGIGDSVRCVEPTSRVSDHQPNQPKHRLLFSLEQKSG